MIPHSKSSVHLFLNLPCSHWTQRFLRSSLQFLKTSYYIYVGYKEMQKGWLIAHTAHLPLSWNILGSGQQQKEVQSLQAIGIFWNLNILSCTEIKNFSKYTHAQKPVVFLGFFCTQSSISSSEWPGFGASFSLCLWSFNSLWFWVILSLGSAQRWPDNCPLTPLRPHPPQVGKQSCLGATPLKCQLEDEVHSGICTT